MQTTLVVRVVALTAVALAAGLAAVWLLGARSRGTPQDAVALSHVRAAARAAEAWYQDPFGGQGSYARLDTAALRREAPAVSPNVHVVVLDHGAGFCLYDVEPSGDSAHYLGGVITRRRVTRCG